MHNKKTAGATTLSSARMHCQRFKEKKGEWKEKNTSINLDFHLFILYRRDDAIERETEGCGAQSVLCKESWSLVPDGKETNNNWNGKTDEQNSLLCWHSRCSHQFQQFGGTSYFSFPHCIFNWIKRDVVVTSCNRSRSIICMEKEEKLWKHFFRCVSDPLKLMLRIPIDIFISSCYIPQKDVSSPY